MIFQTQVPLQKQVENSIDYTSKIMLLGSCFSENMGNQLSYFKFQHSQNPFGILFHPKAIESFITNAIHQKEYVVDDLVFQNERFHCFDAHSSISNPDKNTVLQNLNNAILLANKELKEASHIIITLGTSWVYRFIETNTIVANCHKIPQKNFVKELLSIDEIIKSLNTIISLIQQVNTKAIVLFTVSPIRHIKDGFVENTQSKSHLISAIHQVIHLQNSFYFPSYEIMMDELRDYRFYAEDMLHPNKTAITYIWERFVEMWFADNTKQTMEAVDSIQKGLLHKPFNESSEQHQQFLKNLHKKMEMLQQTFPFMQF